MPNHWTQTLNINESIARKLIEKQHNLKVSSIILLDEGWDNSVYLINKNSVFRFPRRETGVVYMENEIALLPYIAQHIPFPISSPQWIGTSSDLFPAPFSGYPLLPGIVLCEATQNLINKPDFALKLADWVKKLHALPVTEKHATLIKYEQSWRLDVNYLASRCTDYLEQHEKYFLQAGFKKELLMYIIKLLSLTTLESQNMKKSYLHGDLYWRHILVDPKSLLPTGLIDWGTIHVGYPEIDLAVGMIFTKDLFKIFLNAYGDINPESIRIIALHSFTHSMIYLPYAYEQNKEHLKNWVTLALSRAIDEIM